MIEQKNKKTKKTTNNNKNHSSRKVLATKLLKPRRKPMVI